MLDVESGVEIGMCLETTDHTAKRLLIWSVGSIWIMAQAAFLGGVGALDTSGLYASFGRIPGDLFRDTCEIRSTHVGIHGSSFVLHRRHREVFIGKLCALMLGETLVDRPVDLLADVAGETLPALAAGGGELLDPLLFQAFAELGLAAAFLAVALLPLAELAVKRAVVLACTGGQEVSGKGERRYRRSLP